MILVPVSTKDGTWDALKASWSRQCAEFGEDLENFAVEAFSVLEPLAKVGHPKAEIYALKDGDKHEAICQINRTKLPQYDGYVLRVRFMTFAPKYDFGAIEVRQYADTLVELLFRVLELSIGHAPGRLPAKHLKFHLRSPADSQFFRALSNPLGKLPAFKSVEVKGMWLYITKR